MTTTRAQSHRLANAISDVVGPLPVLAALCLAGVRDGRSVLTAIGWGLLAVVLLAVVPYLVTRRLRHPADGSRPGRGRKAGYMALVAALSLGGLVVLAILPSPSSVVDVAIATVITLVAVAVATGVAGWSNHTAACAGGAAMCVVLDGPLWCVLIAAVAAVGWARLELGRHTPAQVTFGAVWGAAVATVALAVLL